MLLCWGPTLSEFVLKQVLGAWNLLQWQNAIAVIKISLLRRPCLSYLWMWPAKNQKHSVPFSTIRRDQRTAITVRRVNSCMVNHKIHQFNLALWILQYLDCHYSTEVSNRTSRHFHVSEYFDTSRSTTKLFIPNGLMWDLFLGLGLPMSEVIRPSGSLSPRDRPPTQSFKVVKTFMKSGRIAAKKLPNTHLGKWITD